MCLANGSGGLLLVGVEDDGEVTGARPRHDGSTDPLRVQALIANRAVPSVTATVERVEVDEVSVLVVDVPDSPRVVGTNGGLYVRRASGSDGRPACVPYLAHEMLAAEIDRGAADYARLRLIGASWGDLDPVELARARVLLSRPGASDPALPSLSDVELLRALGVAFEDRGELVLTAGALLLFGHSESTSRTASSGRCPCRTCSSSGSSGVAALSRSQRWSR